MKFNFVMLLLVLGASDMVSAQTTLPPINVTGQRIYPVGPFHYGYYSPPSYIPPVPTIAKKQATKGQDVRCSALGGLNTVTSQADVTQRWLAAQSAFNTSQSPAIAAGVRAAVIGAGKNPLTGRSVLIYRVTYADDGVESWMLTSNYKHSSIKLVDQPLPGGIEGDGSVKPSSACPTANLAAASPRSTSTSPSAEGRRATAQPLSRRYR